VADGLRGEPAGDAQAPLEAALRIGEERFRFAGTATGSVAREVVRLLDTPTDLVQVRVRGQAGLSAPEEDRSPPSVTLSTPASEAIVPPDAVSVSGTLRDDFTLVRLTYSVDGGPEQDAPFTTDAATGYLDDLRGAFSFPVSTGEGAHSVEVRAYDAAGNEASAMVGFFAAEQRLVPLAAGIQSTAAVDEAGDVRLWGWHTLFAGEGNPLSRATRPTRMPGFEESVAVAVDNYHLLALRADGTVRAAGYNGTGILGLGHTDPVEGIVTVPGLTAVVSLCAGADFAAALRADGTVWTWGLNAYGQLWTGDRTPRSSPAPAPAVPPMRAIFAGSYSLYGVAEDGSLWGRAPFPSEAIERIEGPEDVVSVAVGGALIIVERSGRVWTRGLNNRGQCGRGVYGYSLPLGLVPDVADAVAAAAGGLHSMLLRADGTVLVVGDDLQGQRGDGLPTSTEWTLSFAPVPGLDQVQQVVAAYDRCYAVRRDGGIFAWGAGGNGEIGDGSTGYRAEPVPIPLGE
jgi:alpha-tubulin suppressor-like RCC1 family protein